MRKKVIKIIEQCFNHFLWQGKHSGKGRIRVAWEKVCLPKQEGGLEAYLESFQPNLDCFNHF
jgi:hypothetical protein